jgi:hypothetical protein
MTSLGFGQEEVKILRMGHSVAAHPREASKRLPTQPLWIHMSLCRETGALPPNLRYII